MKHAKPTTKVCSVFLAFVAVLVVVAGRAATAEKNTAAKKPAPGFSFAVYGDSRSMMYLPGNSDQKEEATKLLVDMFDLVLSEKVSEEVVRKDVKLIYDPANGKLVQIVMPFMTRSEVMTLTLDQGWVTEASVEDVKLLPGVRRTMFRLHGGEWVASQVVQAVQSGRAKFILNTGDMVWWGKQGRTPSENPYWKLVYEDVLKQLPASDGQMRAAACQAAFTPPSAITKCGTTPTCRVC
jgi:hypothetical protein